MIKIGNLILKGTSEWVLIDAKKQRVSKITEEMANEYGMVSKSAFDEQINGKISVPDSMRKIYEYKATRRDIDANHHVNNVNYLELAYDAFPEEVDIDFKNFEIYYKKQIKLRRRGFGML